MLNNIQHKPIKGFEHYTISSNGEVNNGRKDLKTFTNNGGYKCLKLTNSEGKKHFTLHRLVALHFIPNPENKPEVNHIDGNKANNSVSNLEWNTSSENKQHGIALGLIVYNKPTEGKKLGGSRKSKSKYFGVNWDKARNKWKVYIRKDNIVYVQKRFENEIEAAKYYNKMCVELGFDKPRNDV